jgi:hypothetical protein
MKEVKNYTINFWFLREIASCQTKPNRSSQNFFCLVTKLCAIDEITRFDGTLTSLNTYSE